LLREDFFVRVEKVDLKHVDVSSSGDSASGGKNGKSGSLRKRGDKVSDSPRPKKQVG
jgi:hypothetical protein